MNVKYANEQARLLTEGRVEFKFNTLTVVTRGKKNPYQYPIEVQKVVRAFHKWAKTYHIKIKTKFHSEISTLIVERT